MSDKPSLPTANFFAGQIGNLDKLKETQALVPRGFELMRTDLGKESGEFRFGVDQVLVGRQAPNRDESFEFPAILGPWRPHALVFVGSQVAKESFGGPGDPLYDEIAQLESKLKGTNDPKQPRAYAGVDFLLYVPELDKFTTLWWKGSAMRNVDDVGKLQGQWVRVWSQRVTQRATGNEWHVPRVELLDPASAARLFPSKDAACLPTEANYQTALSEFKNARPRDATSAGGGAEAAGGQTAAGGRPR